MEFLESHKEAMESLGFWTEEFKSTVILMVENKYKTKVIREWEIVDLTFNGDKALIKWKKRLQPLTDEEIGSKYGR